MNREFLEEAVALQAEHSAAVEALEEDIRARIAADVAPLRGIVSTSPIEFIESRWLAKLDARAEKIHAAFGERMKKLEELHYPGGYQCAQL